LGNFYVNFSIKTVDGRHVAELLRGRRAFITTPVAGWTLAGDEIADMQHGPTIEELSELLSRQLHTYAFTVLDHDDDILVYWLYKNGDQIDYYDSNPHYFDGGDTLPSPSGGQAEKLCAAFGSTAVAEVEKILGEPDGYVFAYERHLDLMKALGFPDVTVGLGYTYVSNGELPKRLKRENITFINP
jgi:hypothetical protein